MSTLNISSVKEDQNTEEKVSIKDLTKLCSMYADYDFCVEYREDIWHNLLAMESERIQMHMQSPQLEFRGALVQQLREVTKSLGLGIETLYSAVTQLDLFMDAHKLRSDRLTLVAMACLSLAAKSEEKFRLAPTLKTLSKISGEKLCGKTFRQLEWMIGQHVRWRLLMPTPVTYAGLLAQFVVTDRDLTVRHPKFVMKFQRDGMKMLYAFLDLTLSDVRLRTVECVDVGCACVCAARTYLGHTAWPAWLATITGRHADTVAPITRLLHKMMEVVKAREAADEVDQGYGSARTSPSQTPSASPRAQASPDQHRINTIPYSVLDLNDSILNPELRYEPLNTNCRFVSVEPSERKAVKRGALSSVDLDRKRIKMTYQMSQVTL